MTTRDASPARRAGETVKSLAPVHTISLLGDLVIFILVCLLVSLVRLDHYGGFSLTLALLGLGGLIAASLRDSEEDVAGLLGAFGALFLLLTWHIPTLVTGPVELGAELRDPWAWGPIVPPELTTFAVACLITGGGAAGAIIWRLPQLARKAMWGSVAALVPVLVLALAWWRIGDLGTHIPMAIIAGLTGAGMAFATAWANREQTHCGMPAVAALASSATAALALGFAMVLQDAWLTLALSLEIMALAFIWQKTGVDGLRQVAKALAIVILARLFLNPELLTYHEGPLGVFNWLIQGYLVPAALFEGARRLFMREKRSFDSLDNLLHGGAIMLLVSYVTLETWVLTNSNSEIDGEPEGLTVLMLTINWSIASVLLYWRELKTGSTLLGWLRRAMTIASALALLAGGAIANNIFLGKWVTVKGMPLFNEMTAQLLLPALLYTAKTWMASLHDKALSMKLYGAVAFTTGLFWISSEIRFFWAYMYDAQTISDWENYTYSVTWLAVSIGLVIVGLKVKSETIRRAGLGMLSLVVLKVFFIDMSSLEGLARALSFIGLGAAMIGIGWLYQRLRVREQVAE